MGAPAASEALHSATAIDPAPSRCRAAVGPGRRRVREGGRHGEGAIPRHRCPGARRAGHLSGAGERMARDRLTTRSAARRPAASSRRSARLTAQPASGTLAVKATARPTDGQPAKDRRVMVLRRSTIGRCLGWLRGWGPAAFTLAIAAIGVLPGTLCLGSDGHVAIEVARAGRCVDGEQTAGATARSAPARELLPAPPSRDCGPCTE